MIEITAENQTGDSEAIEVLYDHAFGPGHFAKTAERLREATRSLLDCTRVARLSGRIVGACRIWPIEIGEAKQSAVFVGPLAVAADQRGSFLGHELCQKALSASREAGWQNALIIGSPTYFTPLGFQVVEPDQLMFRGPQDMARVMVMPLTDDAPKLSGRVGAAPPRRPIV